MSFRRGFLPRNVRRTIHPVRSTLWSKKRELTPRPVRLYEYAKHPRGAITTAAGRAARRSLRRGW